MTVFRANMLGRWECSVLRIIIIEAARPMRGYRTRREISGAEVCERGFSGRPSTNI